MTKACRGGNLPSAGLQKIRLAALLTALLIGLSGCASLWEREIYERSPHITQEDDGAFSATMTVNSYDSLKSAIVSAIRNGERVADIRVTDYPGGLTSLSLTALLDEIQKQEPIGAYAVEYMAHDLSRVLSQYIITLNIVYKHGSRPVITPVSGRRELEDAVRSALMEYVGLLTVEMPYFYARDHDVEGMVRAYYYGSPGSAMEYPGVAVSLFPPSGGPLSRIVELELTWQTPAAELMRKSSAAESRAALLLTGLQGFAGGMEEVAAQTVLWLYETLCGAVEYDEDTAMLAAATETRQGGDAYTAYGALVNHLAVSEGTAMAFKLLCDMLGIEAHVVTGRWWGNEHAWNLVKIGEHWYHAAIALDSRGPVPAHDYFLLSDDSDVMGSLFQWDKSLYPAAEPGPWTAETIRALTEEEEVDG
ncbi:MAG: hypothetical protein FWG72_03820 [Oscillospiraceae bacterium]|nr:hypothetical protein [Oscillospiraceae bacterium]